MAYANPCARRRAPVRASAAGHLRHGRRGVGSAILAAAWLVIAIVVLTGACVAITSLAARSVLRVGMPTTVVAAIRVDANRDLAERVNRSLLVAEIPERPDAAPEWQLASVDSRPAGPCGGVPAGTRAEALAAKPSSVAADLVMSDSIPFAGAPCLTGDDLRATASALPDAGFMLDRRPAPVLAMAVPVTPDEPKPDPARDYTGSIGPSAALPAAPKLQPRRDDLSGYPASLAVLDGRTAVYDIVAKTVYMPDGTRLEAHSGLGAKRDDPRYVHVRMHGATPPNVYDLRMREALFHGVRAIRMTPVDRGKMFGRDGILAHTYMLGPNGQSNGCVSFRNYDAFLNAFLKGEVKRIVVVARLPAPPTRAMLRGVRSEQIAAMNSERTGDGW